MASRTIAAFKALFGSSGSEFPDNTTGLITEAKVRAQGEDIADSFYNKTDDAIASITTPGVFDQFDSVKNYFTDIKTAFLGPYAGYMAATGTSYSQTVVQNSDIPVSCVLRVTARISGIKSDGTEGYGGEVVATFRKSSGGTLAIVGASASVIVEDVTGSVTGALQTSGTGIQLAVGMGAASGDFTQVAWIEIIRAYI
jgi:hypothetical protein